MIYYIYMLSRVAPLQGRAKSHQGILVTTRTSRFSRSFNRVTFSTDTVVFKDIKFNRVLILCLIPYVIWCITPNSNWQGSIAKYLYEC